MKAFAIFDFIGGWPNVESVHEMAVKSRFAYSSLHKVGFGKGVNDRSDFATSEEVEACYAKRNH